jgi:outer membrane protein
MKKNILILLATFSMTSVFAQKMATVNSNELVFSMPETKALQGKIQEKQNELSKQLETMYKDYQTKAEALKNIDMKAMTAIQEAKVKELQDLQKRIESFEQAAQKEVQKMEQDMSVPIIEKAKKNIEIVAKEKGYSHVFDVSGGGLIVYPTADDITAATKTKMGISLTAPVATPAPAAPKK